MAKLCVEALKRHIEPDYVRSLVVEHRLVPQTPPTDVPGWPWPVRMITLGCFRLEKCGEPVPSSRKAQQRPLAMLKYLVARGGRNIPAYEIEEVLWPDADGDAASNAFSTTLHRLRKLLGNDDAVRYAEAALSLDEFLVWVDVPALERCCLQVERILAGPCAAADLQPLRDTLVALYPGPFLPGELSAWAIPLRERLQARFFITLGALAHAFEKLGSLEDAAQCCRYGLTLDPLVESFYCPLIRITFYQGRKSEALQLYERCRTLLDSELGLTPSEMLESVKKSLFA
jgi:two-component SAPR family response regulator